MGRVCWLVLLVVVWGCGGVKKADLVGTWAGTLHLSDLALDNAVAAAKVSSGGREFTKQEILDLMAATGTSISLNEDDTYTMMFGPASYAGKWSLEASTILLTVEKINGVDPEVVAQTLGQDVNLAKMGKQPWNLAVSEDGKKLNGSDPTDAGTTVEFTRP